MNKKLPQICNLVYSEQIYMKDTSTATYAVSHHVKIKDGWGNIITDILTATVIALNRQNLFFFGKPLSLDFYINKDLLMKELVICILLICMLTLFSNMEKAGMFSRKKWLSLEVIHGSFMTDRLTDRWMQTDRQTDTDLQANNYYYVHLLVHRNKNMAVCVPLNCNVLCRPGT